MFSTSDTLYSIGGEAADHVATLNTVEALPPLCKHDGPLSRQWLEQLRHCLMTTFVVPKNL